MTREKASPTMRDIAARLGLSAMTVSRALRNTGRVSAATVEKVRKIAEEIGYRPNPLVQTLMASVRRGRVEQSTALAWVMNYERGAPHPAVLDVMESGARDRADALGFGLQKVYLPEESSDAANLRRTLWARGISGVVIAPLPTPGTLDQFPWDHFAAATIGRSLQSPLLHYVTPHYYHTMARILQAARTRGYRRIGMLASSDMDIRAEESFSMVFEHFFRTTRKALGNALQYYNGWTIERYAKWLQTFHPDVVIIPFPTLIRPLREAGAEIPERIALVCQSWRESHPEVTGMRQPMRELGAVAVDLVVEQIYRNQRGVPDRVKAVMLEGEWVEGTTLPCRR